MQSSTGTRSWLRRARKPARPSASTPSRKVVRKPTGSSAGPATTWGFTSRPVRVSASRTMATFSRTCSCSVTCCQPQPPQPALTYGHGGGRRASAAARTSTSAARAKSAFSSVRRASTRSPGRAPVTNTTRPLGSLAIASPPATMRSVSSSTVAIPARR